MPKLILIMIDGVSAEYFATHRARVPHMAALAEQGTVVDTLAADTPATSLPGRTSILTGVTPDVHGIYGNVIWDGERFRYANPDDVRIETLPKRAKDAGLDVAITGYGMVRPEDAEVFHHAWWANEMLQRARDEAPIPADEGWLRTSRYQDPTGRLEALAQAGLPQTVPDAYAGDRMHYFMSELAGDQIMLQWTAGLATSAQAPDLIVTEILTTDSVQHVAGYEHPFSHWAISYADNLVGTLVDSLRRAGRLDEYTLVITSDHGHGPAERALYPDAIVPGLEFSPEAGILYATLGDGRERQALTETLAEHGIEPLPHPPVPPEQQEKVAAFSAPAGTWFEKKPEGAKGVSGPPKYASGHGFKPGTRSNARFALFAGAGITPGTIEHAEAEQLAPTLAKMLGLSLEPYPQTPIF